MGTRGIQQGCKRNARQQYRDTVGMLRGDAISLQLGVQEATQHGCNRDAMQQVKRQCNRERKAGGNTTGCKGVQWGM